jgi:hypothetical protein
LSWLTGQQTVLVGRTTNSPGLQDNRQPRLAGQQTILVGWTTDSPGWQDKRYSWLAGQQTVMVGRTTDSPGWQDKRYSWLAGQQTVLVGRTTDSHLKRIISTNCCIHTVVPPNDGPGYARNMRRLTKCTKNKMCVKLVFLSTFCGNSTSTCFYSLYCI